MPQKFSILIVEDDNDARKNMEDILSLDGYETQSTTHCLGAINSVESHSFDAVIVDWKLPDENADHLIPLISKHQPNTPVVVVTGMRDFDTAVTALRSGAYDFLLKPINADVLRSVLGRIVERKQHLTAIEKAQEKLLMNERLAAIGQMVTGLAHETRNAFQRSHACLAELALDLEGLPQSLELVRKVQNALDDVHHLLEEVRDYSAPIILERRKTCLESLIRETWQHVLDTKDANQSPDLTIKLDQDFPAECYLDTDRIRQVIRNLLENAFFASAGQGQILVKLCFSKSKNRIQIEVIDDGEGVKPEDREQIFAPFFTTKTKGTGLGLAVSRRYVDAQGGKIYVESAETLGARFIIELPYCQK